jgi:hypothetical protein
MTEAFLRNVVGSYIKVVIKDNVAKCKLVLNKKMEAENNLLDNARCYTDYSAPTMRREHGIEDMMKDMCAIYKMDDATFYIGLGDFPIIHKDRTLHPHADRFASKKHNVYPKKLDKVFSRSVIPNLHDDIMIPTRDFIETVYKFDELLKKTNYNFRGKKGVAVFRGSITGNDRSIANTRIHAAILGLNYPKLLNVRLTRTFPYFIWTEGTGFVFTNITNKLIYDETTNSDIPLDLQGSHFKYILHIDGFVSAWRMAQEMMTMSVILKVDSPWVEHYYEDLKPWVHYIPIKSDLSDLIQTIVWCNDHVDECEIIAKNALTYAKKAFTKERLFGYMMTQIYGNPKLDLISADSGIEPPTISPSLPQLKNRIEITDLECEYYILPVAVKHMLYQQLKSKYQIIDIPPITASILGGGTDIIKPMGPYDKPNKLQLTDEVLEYHDSIYSVGSLLNWAEPDVVLKKIADMREFGLTVLMQSLNRDCEYVLDDGTIQTTVKCPKGKMLVVDPSVHISKADGNKSMPGISFIHFIIDPKSIIERNRVFRTKDFMDLNISYGKKEYDVYGYEFETTYDASKITNFREKELPDFVELISWNRDDLNVIYDRLGHVYWNSATDHSKMIRYPNNVRFASKDRMIPTGSITLKGVFYYLCAEARLQLLI